MHPTHPTTTRPAQAVDISPADILRGAARYLEIHGWTQASYYTNAADPFPPACALGAIGMAAHGRLIPIPTDSGAGARDCRRAIDYLTRYLDDLGVTATTGDDWSTDPVTPIDWNDRDSQSAQTVITALRAAADAYAWAHATDDQLETYAESAYANEHVPTRDGFLAWLGAR